MSRIMEWIDRDNARIDEILASRSTHWLVARTTLGVVVMGKGIALGMHAAHACTLHTPGNMRWRRSCSPAASYSRSKAPKLFWPASREASGSAHRMKFGSRAS